MGVGIDDIIGLIGLQPDFFATAEQTRGKPLLKPKRTHD